MSLQNLHRAMSLQNLHRAMRTTVSGDVDPAGLRAVGALIEARTCRSAVYCQTTASTNTLALEAARDPGIPPSERPRLFVTDQQTAGRGRHGRSWSSNRGTLTFSLLIDWPAALAAANKPLSVAVGVGIARAVEFICAPIRTRLKWPNDVYLNGGKIAGVLVETSPSAIGMAVVGVGVNVSAPPEFDAPQAAPVSSISEVAGRPYARYDLLEPLVAEIVTAINALEQQAEIITEFRDRCLLTGQTIRFQQQGREIQGQCRGIGSQGQLRVATATGEILLQSGEAHVIRKL